VLRLLLLVVAAWLVVCFFLFLRPREDAPARADAVVVLAGGRKQRLEKGLELVRRGVSDVLVISDGRSEEWPQANRLCREGGRGFRVLCFRPDPYSTQGEARAVARLGRRRGWRSVAVVTSTFHVYRSRLLVERCFGGSVAVVGARYKLRYVPAALFWETGKLIWALAVDREC
jgi:uncharacterized SAM-binding protein YcdF (DUF218 family)